MSIPGFQKFMLPLLRLIGAHGEMTTSAYCEALANEFGLSQEDREEMIPSGRQPVYKNRITWAGTYLVKSGLLERPKRGLIRITPRGKTVLSENLDEIGITYLSRFPDFEAFRSSRDGDDEPGPTSQDGEAEENLPPNESILQGYRQLRRTLAQDILDRIKAAPPEFFEQLVVDLLVRMGYGGTLEDAGQAIGKSGDGGIDGIIKEDRLGLDFVYIQAKRWENTVHAPEIRGFAGSLEERRARRGVFITTSSFSSGAKSFVNNIEKRIVLVDGEELASLMLDYGLGVTDVATYKVQRIDPAYFGEE